MDVTNELNLPLHVDHPETDRKCEQSNSCPYGDVTVSDSKLEVNMQIGVCPP